MRKLFSYCGSAASKVFMTLAMLIASVIMAHAADPIPITEVNQVLSAGVEYSYGQYTKIYASFTVPATGKLRIDGFQGFHIYEKCVTPGVKYDEERNDATSVDTGGMVREIQVTEGKTMYFVDEFTMDAGTVTLYMEGMDRIPLEIQYLQPNDTGDKVDFNNYPTLQVTFNQVVKVTDTNAVISFQNRLTGAVSALTSRVTGSGTRMISVPVYNILKPYIASGAINPGDEFKITVRTLVSEHGEPYVNADANGNCVFTYLCGSIPTVCTQQYCPDPFVSYWPEGTPEGILKMTFNGELGFSEKTYAALNWGNQEGEEGQYYHEELPVKIEGNVLTVDFTGKLRTPATMTPMFPNSSYNQMVVEVIGVVDQYGVPVGSEGLGTIGSYSFAPTYRKLERTTIAAEFEPASGSDLTEVSTVNVWISGINGMTFDGFKIEATDKNTDAVTTYIIDMKDVTVTPDGSDAAEYEFAMPQEVIANAKTAVVTLNNVVSLDGYSHDNDVRAVYGGFVITYSDPANGAELATLNDGDIITIEVNIAEKYPEMYVEYQIVDLAPEEGEDDIIKSSSWMNRQEDGSYQATVYGNYKLMYGKEYRVEFSAWESEMVKNYTPLETLGSDQIILRGLTAPYIYSVIAMTDIQPAADSLLSEDCSQISVTFDGIVNLGRTTGYDLETGIVSGMGAGLQAFKEVTPVDPVEVDGVVYSSQWNLVLPDHYLATQKTPMLVSFKAYDEEGRIVKGNEGKDEDTYFLYSYDTPGMYQPVTVTLPEAPITKLSEITVSYPTGISVSWDFPYSDVKILNRFNTEVASMADFTFEEDPDNPFAVITEGKIVLDKTISEEGIYMLSIPRGFFNLGTEFDTAKNEAVNQIITIAAAPYSVVPEEGDVKTLETIVISYNGGDITISDAADAQKPTWSYDEDATPRSFSEIRPDGNTLILTFKAAISEEGTYYVTVPDGYVLFTDGSAAPAVNLTYMIAGQNVRPNITVTPEEGKVASIPQSLDIIFNDYEEAGSGSGKATLTVNGGTPIVLPDAEFGMEYNEMLQGTGADTGYTEDGTYVFSFPKGYFLLGSNGTESPAFTLSYTIGDVTPSYGVTFTPEPGVVKSLSRIDLRFDNETMVGPGNGTATLTIDGGEAIALPELEIDWEAEMNEIIQPLDKTYDADGTYTIFFPAGYFLLGEDGTESEEMTVVYTLDKGSSAIEGVDIEAKSYTVYTLGGVRILDRADRAAYKALAPGLYIVNGVKVIIK